MKSVAVLGDALVVYRYVCDVEPSLGVVANHGTPV
jgi:hypothetical protein